MAKAFVFPGQGSQAVGMGKALAEAFPAARAVFDEVDAALGEKLSALMFEGPEADLVLTANAQPALMAVSLAATRVLEAEAGLDLARDAKFVAGHSLGEYSALAAAGAFSLADAARLLRLRGKAMQAAVPVGQGAMAALLGLDYETGVAVAAEGERGRTLARIRPGIAGIDDRDLRPVKGPAKPERVADEVRRRPGQGSGPGQRARAVIGKRVDADKPCSPAAQPVGKGRVGTRRKRGSAHRLEPALECRVPIEPAPAEAVERGAAHAASLAGGMAASAASTTAIPAPSLCAFSDRIRRQARAPGRPEKRPSMWRVIWFRRPPADRCASI